MPWEEEKNGEKSFQEVDKEEDSSQSGSETIFKLLGNKTLFELFFIGNWRVELNYFSRLHLIQQIKMKVWFYNVNKLRLVWPLYEERWGQVRLAIGKEAT